MDRSGVVVLLVRAEDAERAVAAVKAALAAAPPKRTPKNGDTLGSFSAAELADLPVGSKFVHPTNGYGDITRVTAGIWSKGPPSVGWDSSAMLAANAAFRTLVLPAAPIPAPPKRIPKNGDTLGSFTAAELEALPVGSEFVWNTTSNPVAKAESGVWYDRGLSMASDVLVMSTNPWTVPYYDPARTLRLPKSAAPTLPAVGTLLSDVTEAQLAALPVGSRFEDSEDAKRGCLDLYALNKEDDGWKAGWMPIVDSPMADWRKAFGDKYRLVRIGQAVPATPAPTPKPLDFGTRLSATTDADLDALPVGSRFEDWEPVLGLAHAPIVKTTAGWRFDAPNATPMSSAWWRGEFGGHRLARRGWLNTPNPGRNGDRLGSFAPADLDALPVGSAFTLGSSVVQKHPHGFWLRNGLGGARWLLCNGDPNRTLTLPRSTK